MANTFVDNARLCRSVTIQLIKDELSVPSPCFATLKSFLICAVVVTKRLRDVAQSLRPLPCRVEVTTSRESAPLASTAGAIRRSLQTSHRSTQTKRYSCNSGAAVQQSAGSVGGFQQETSFTLCSVGFWRCKKDEFASRRYATKKSIKFHVQVDVTVH